MQKRQVYKLVLELAREIAKQKKGAMFVIADERKIKRYYELLYPKLIEGYYLNEEGINKVLEKLATLDGAVIITPAGKLVAYGAKLKKSKTIHGFGTRHATAAGITAAIKDSIAIIVSEESNLIRVFKGGMLKLEMDSQKRSRSMDDKIISFLSEGDNALLAAAGASAAILGGAALLNPVVAPVIIVGGSAYLALKAAGRVIRSRRNK
jgi:hypothetical protein